MLPVGDEEPWPLLAPGIYSRRPGRHGTAGRNPLPVAASASARRGVCRCRRRLPAWGWNQNRIINIISGASDGSSSATGRPGTRVKKRGGARPPSAISAAHGRNPRPLPGLSGLAVPFHPWPPAFLANCTHQARPCADSLIHPCQSSKNKNKRQRHAVMHPPCMTGCWKPAVN